MNDTYRPKALPGRVSHRGNVTPASSGRVDGPAACRARRGPDGVRGVVDLCDPAKIYDIPGLPTGDIPSRKRTAVRTSMLEHIVFHLSLTQTHGFAPDSVWRGTPPPFKNSAQHRKKKEPLE